MIGALTLQRRSLLLASVGVVIGLHAKGTMANIAPATSGIIVLEGLHGPIEIVEDTLGIPHVRAGSKRDAFFAQGYLVARDRLFQIDLDHRQQLGRMAEVFGPTFLPGDRAARAFHYRGDIDAELAAIPFAVRDCVEGYIAGVNARIGETQADSTLLSPEFAILGIRPLLWDLREMVAMRGLASSNAGDEIRRAMLAARGLLELDHYMDPLRPAHRFTIPDGLDIHAVSKGDLGLLSDLHPPSFEQPQFADRDIAATMADWINQGSNAWTVAGSRTETGRPILANDPHLSIGGFSPRHIVHLTAPGLNVIGAGYPGLPGIMQGHTEHYAFGRTNFHIDQTDLYILETDPSRPEQYRHHGEWVHFDEYEESIPVRGTEDESLILQYANGRPVIAADSEKGRAVAAATVTMLPGANMRFAIVAINLAPDWKGLLEAFKLHVSPTNLHYADADGNIGWHAIGYTPKRPAHDGLFPVPGDGRYDWEGILRVEEMPSLFNPEEGWIASANAYNIPAGYPFDDHPLSFSWNDPFRHDRIREVLAAQDKHSIEDSIALMHDVQSLPARALKALIPTTPSSQAAEAAALLCGWDCNIGKASNAALLYEMVLPKLTEIFHRHVIPPEVRDLIPTVNLSVMLTSLNQLDQRLGNDPAAVRDTMLNQALSEGWQRAVALAGNDPMQWRWGDLHRVKITHPLSGLPAIAATFPAIEGGRSGGDGTTVMARGMSADHHWDVRHGASFLFAADVSEWDRSRYLLLPGQSGNPASPHYEDFYSLWLDATMQPMNFTPDAVDGSAVKRIVLRSAHNAPDQN